MRRPGWCSTARSRSCGATACTGSRRWSRSAAGQFTGEVSQLGGRGTLAAGHAGPRGLHRAAVRCRASPRAGDRLGRARRDRDARLHPAPRRAARRRAASGSVLIGRPGTPDLVAAAGLSQRATAIPIRCSMRSPTKRAARLVERFGVLPDELPLMICPNGALLKRPTDAEAGMCLGITPELDPQDGLRRRRGRRRTRGPCRRGLRRLGRAVGDRARPARFRRPGRRLGADRELSRLSDRHLRPGAGRPRLQPGAEIRRRDRHSARGGAGSIATARARRAVAARHRRRQAVAGAHDRHRLRRALSPARHCQPSRLRGRRRLLLGVADRGEALRGRGSRAGRRRQFGRAGGGVPCAARSSACIWSCAATGSKRRCRAI